MTVSPRALQPPKRVAIIGAGSAGITQAKQLLDAFASSDYALEMIVFEARKLVGGVWLEDPLAGEWVTRFDDAGEAHISSVRPGVLPSPIYAGLRTNLPHDLMTYRSTPFPPSTETFPKASPVCDYLQSYAFNHGVLPYIRFETSVTRIRLAGPGDLADSDVTIEAKGETLRRWVVESESLGDSAEVERKAESFDFVSIANGHYEKVWVPTVPGMERFTGTIIHSKFYRRPEAFRGQTVLVVGSLSSGSDLARELACLNCSTSSLPAAMRIPEDAPVDRDEVHRLSTKVIQSSRSGAEGLDGKEEYEDRDEQGEPWVKHIRRKGLIERFENPSPDDLAIGRKSSIVFTDESTLTDVDVIIYATGYSYYLPFFKIKDEPWCRSVVRPLEREILPVDVVKRNKDGSEGLGALGGLHGQGMRNLDETQLFLKKDSSLAFLGLPYMVVPFQLCESQSHLVALFWAGRLPNFSQSGSHRPRNPKDDPEPSRAIANGSPVLSEPQRPGRTRTETVRTGFAYGFPYEFEYQDWLAELCAEAYADEDEAKFWRVAKERWERRADGSLRKRVLGY